jgi:protein O-mannosyl-transferase
MRRQSFLQKGQRGEAIAHLEKELQINPARADAHNKLGLAWSQEGRIDQAISEWQKTLELQPNDLNAHFYLAWIFATFPDDTIRNGTKAISLAERALHLSGEKDPRIYRLLAAAYAENGQFDEAIQTAQRGSHLAIEQENQALADRLESDIDLYRRNVPLRDRGE